MSEIHRPPGRRPGLTLNFIYTQCHDSKEHTFFPGMIGFHYRYMGEGDEANPISLQVLLTGCFMSDEFTKLI